MFWICFFFCEPKEGEKQRKEKKSKKEKKQESYWGWNLLRQMVVVTQVEVK
jgi:lipoprotein NlpI